MKPSASDDLLLIGKRMKVVIDLDAPQAPVQIDLTGPGHNNKAPIDLTLDSDSEPELTGCRFNTTTNKRLKAQDAEQRKRRRVEDERKRVNGRASSSSSLTAGPSRKSESPEVIWATVNVPIASSSTQR